MGSSKLYDSYKSGMFVKLTASPIFMKSEKFGGGKREELTRLLTEFQVRATEEEAKPVWTEPLPWLWDVKDAVYDLETLLEDIEFDDMAKNESGVKESRIHRLIEAQKESDEWYCHHHGCLPNQGPSLEERVAKVLGRLEDIYKEVTRSDDLRPRVSISSILYQEETAIARPQNSTDRPTKANLDFVDMLADDPFKSHLLKYISHGGPVYYNQLPWYLKQCYAFCRLLFPPNDRFQKHHMVSLWVAAGFVQPIVGKTLEEVAAGYFDALSHWSFFEMYSETASTPWYTLNLKSSRLSRSISEGGEFHMVETSEVGNRVRHASVSGKSFLRRNVFEPAHRPSGLYTLILLPEEAEYVTDYIFWRLKELRVSKLSRCKFITAHICKLTHLRHLDLSFSNVRTLPSSLSYLFRLKTLRLLGCRDLKYPENFHFLSENLIHLELDCASNMPPNIGRFTRLQTLPHFDVDVRNQNGNSICQLGDLNELRGSLCVSQLEDVQTLEEAQNAKLHLKSHLESLTLSWYKYVENCTTNYGIAEGLIPHPNIRKIEIEGFEGLRLPSWLSQTSFINLGALDIGSCVLHQLPALGKLPQLKDLKIESVCGLKKIGAEFYGSFLRKKAFPQLRSLEISCLNDLEEWIGWRFCDFPVLEILHISDCPELRSLPCMENLSKLTEMRIHWCRELQSLPPGGMPSSLQSLSITCCLGLYRSRKRGGSDWDRVSNILERCTWTGV